MECPLLWSPLNFQSDFPFGILKTVKCEMNTVSVKLPQLQLRQVLDQNITKFFIEIIFLKFLILHSTVAAEHSSYAVATHY